MSEAKQIRIESRPDFTDELGYYPVEEVHAILALSRMTRDRRKAVIAAAKEAIESGNFVPSPPMDDLIKELSKESPNDRRNSR